jgi:hypothetical protein
MARRSLRVASSPATPKKRPSSSTPVTAERTSKRLRSAEKPDTASAAKSTPKKSKYFESEPADAEASSVEAEISESGYEDEEGSAAASEESSPESEYYDDDSEDQKPKKRGRGRTSAGSKKESNEAGKETEVAVRSGGKGKELWRPGVKTGLGPGKQVFIKIPKARGPGRTPYQDGTIHPNTMAFLGDLKANNEREWMKSKCLVLLEGR